MPECPIGARVAALRELSAALHAELPDELSLVILLHWGGVQHPTASILLTDPRLRAFFMAPDPFDSPRDMRGLASRVSGLSWCGCGFLDDDPNRVRHHPLRKQLAKHDTFRPTRGLASHIRRITLNAEGGYRDRDDQTLDRFGQAWCAATRCALTDMWRRLWHNARGLTPRHAHGLHAREFSLVEFLRRSSTNRLVQDYYGLTGRLLPFDLRHQPGDDARPVRRPIIRDILATDTESHGVQQHAPEDPAEAAAEA